MGGVASNEQKGRGLDADGETLVSQLNRIVCSKIAKSLDSDLEQMNSPDYCRDITVLAKGALTKYMQSQTVEGNKDVYILKDQIGSPGQSPEKQKLCEDLAYRYVLIYKIYQLIRATVGHVGSVQRLCSKITPKAKNFGGGYCQERLQAMALRADSAVRGATISSKLCHLPSTASKGPPAWAKKLDELFTSMKTTKHENQQQTAQIAALNTRIGKHDASSALTSDNVQKFADIKQLDRSLSVPEGVCTETGTDRLPNAYYEFQITDPTLLGKYQEIVKGMRTVMDGAVLKLSAVLRKIFTGFNKPGEELTLVPGLTTDKLQALATETRNEVVAMLIACDTRYVEALGMFATTVAEKHEQVPGTRAGAYTSIAGDARDAANAAVKKDSSRFPDYSSGYYSYGSNSLYEKQARLDTYKPHFHGTTRAQERDLPSVMAKAYSDEYDKNLDKQRPTTDSLGLDEDTSYRKQDDLYGRYTDPYGRYGDPHGRRVSTHRRYGDPYPYYAGPHDYSELTALRGDKTDAPPQKDSDDVKPEPAS